MPFATVITSGVTPQCSDANIFPVLPNPVTTSSAMSTTPYLVHISRNMGQYSSPGTATLIGDAIGSAMTAQTLSGP